MRSYRIAAIFLCGLFLLALGILMLSPLKEVVCDNAADQYRDNCPSYNIVLVAAWKIGELFRDSAFISTLATIAIAGFTATLWWSTRGLLRATDRTVDLTSQNFAAEHRPWIAVDAEISQLRFENGIGYIKLAYSLKNTGNSPAGATFVNCKPFVVVPGAAFPVDPEIFRKETATKAAQLRRFDGYRGGVIFPGQERVGLFDLVLTGDNLNKASPPAVPGTPVTVFILVGADYCFMFADGSHQTVATFTVGPFNVPQVDVIMTLAKLQRFSLGDYAD